MYGQKAIKISSEKSSRETYDTPSNPPKRHRGRNKRRHVLAELTISGKMSIKCLVSCNDQEDQMLLKILLKDLTFKYMHMHIFTWSDEFHVPQVFLQYFAQRV